MKIQVKRGTAAALRSANPVLASGEFCKETDTGLIKCGDGSTAWNSLPYLSVLTAWGDKEIVSGDNLDNYINSGTFTCRNGETAATVLNTPYTGGNFKLYTNLNTADKINPTLAESKFGSQMLITGNSDGGIWFRGYRGSAIAEGGNPWLDWRQVALVESGSNANGNYVKFSDGTMICYCANTTSSVLGGATWTGGLIHRYLTLTFPSMFINTNVAITAGGSIDGTIGFYSAQTASSNGTFILRILNTTPVGETISCNYRYIAVGRWK